MKTKSTATNAAFSDPKLATLLEESTRQGHISYDRLNELLGDLPIDKDGAEALFDVLESRGVALEDDREGNVRAAHQEGYADAKTARGASTSAPASTRSAQSKAKTPRAPGEMKVVGESEGKKEAAPTRAKRDGDLDEVLSSLDALMSAAPGTTISRDAPAREDAASTRALLDEAKTATPETVAAAFADDEIDVAPDAPVADALSQYMHQLGRVPLLSADEERTLAEEARAGSQSAKQRLVEANLRLVVHLARPYAGRAAMPLMDVVQEGNLGLIRAVEKFDPARGQRLSSYASWYIRDAINRAVSVQSRSIRLPSHLSALIQKLQRVQRELMQKHGREPFRHELAEALGVAEEQVEELQRVGTAPLSLDAPSRSGDDESDEFGERLMTDDMSDDIPMAALARGELRGELESAMEKLSRRERAILMQRFGMGEYADSGARSLDDIAASMNLSRDRARQLEIRALRKMRRRAKGHFGPDGSSDGDE